MMLYDRLLEAMVRTKRSGRPLTTIERALGPVIVRAVVYQLTPVLPLMADFKSYADRPIPKRAPHRATWCEWTENGEEIGTLVQEFTDPVAIGKIIGDLKTDAPCDVLFVVNGFTMVNGSAHIVYPVNLLAWSNEGRLAFGCASRVRDDSEQGVVSAYSMFGLNVYMLAQDVEQNAIRYWAPIMAFMLMSCKNVAVERHEPDAKTQRAVKRSGNPPRSSWHTLSIKVPATHKAKLPSGTPEPDESSVRFHLCRGHFKNLKHPKFKEPGLHWWPAHWRGDPELGTVVTDRKLTPG